MTFIAGIQVNLTMKKTKEKGTQVYRRRKPVISTPVKRHCNAQRAEGTKRRRQECRKEASFLVSPDASPVACKADRQDTTYEPDNSTCTLEATFVDELVGFIFICPCSKLVTCNDEELQ